MAKGGGIEKGIDLFEDYDNIPNNVQSILDKYSSAFEDGEYKGLENALKALNKIGYTFDYDLEGQAYDLRKTSQKGKSSYAKGGRVGKEKEIYEYYSEQIEDAPNFLYSEIERDVIKKFNLGSIENLHKILNKFPPLNKMAKGGGVKLKKTIAVYKITKPFEVESEDNPDKLYKLKKDQEVNVIEYDEDGGLAFLNINGKSYTTYDLLDMAKFVKGRKLNFKLENGGGVGVKKNELQKGYVALKSYWKVASKPSKLKEVPTTTISSIDRDAVINYLNSLEVISEYLEGNVPYTNPDVGYGPIEENYLLYDKEEGDIYFIDTQGYNYPRYITRLAGYKPKSSEEFKLGGGVGGNKKISEAIDDIVKYATLPPQIDYVKPYAFKSEKAYRYLESLPNGKKYIDRAHRKIDEYYESDAPHYDSLFKNGGGVGSQFEYTIGGL